MPTDHEARGQRSSGCGKSEGAAAELCQESKRPSFGGMHTQRPKQNTTTIASTLGPSASGQEQDSDVNAKEEETAWCWSVQEATRSTWRNSWLRRSSWSAMRTSYRAQRTDENNEKSPAAPSSTRVNKDRKERTHSWLEKERTHSGEEKVRFNATMNTRQKQPRRCSGNHGPGRRFVGKTAENRISYPTVRVAGGQDKTYLRDVEVPPMHDIGNIVRRCCAETKEGLKRPKEMNPWQ